MSSGTIDEDANRVVESIVEQDLEELLRLKNMEEIEELYGMPVIVGPYSGFHDFTLTQFSEFQFSSLVCIESIPSSRP